MLGLIVNAFPAWLNAAVIDVRRNLVGIQNGRATVKVRPDAVTTLMKRDANSRKERST